MSTDHLIRIALFDEQTFHRRAIRRLLDTAGDLTVIAVCANLQEFRLISPKQSPDIVILGGGGR